MRKIIKYKIVEEAKLPGDTDFHFIIQNMIEKGWQPYGSPYVVVVLNQSYKCQAMVQYAPFTCPV